MQATTLAVAFLLLTGACASTPGERGSQEAANKPLRRGIAEFRLTSYDGHHLEGRVLLGATVDPLVINGRLIEDRDLELEKVRACGTTELLEYYVVDRVGPNRPEDVITLPRGYWHGTNAFFLLWDKQTGLGPDCFQATLVVRVRDSRIAATLPIRVVRTDKPPAPPDGGTGEPKPPASDAGAP
jgi:hypothetical protein